MDVNRSPHGSTPCVTKAGNFGDSASVGEGVIELRVHVGAGYRVYCGRHGEAFVITLWWR